MLDHFLVEGLQDLKAALQIVDSIHGLGGCRRRRSGLDGDIRYSRGLENALHHVELREQLSERPI